MAVEVHLWSGLRRFVGGRETVEVEASNVGELLRELAKIDPGLEAAIEAGVSVSIDGRIYGYTLTEPVSPENEIFLLQRIKGG